MGTKLHLGCGTRKIPGFINVDCRSEVEPDIRADFFHLDRERFQPGTASLIYCSHALEHVSRRDALAALWTWRNLLEKGGILRLSVPDLNECFIAYLQYNDLRVIQNLLYGKQEHEWDFHKTGWDRKSLERDLYTAGFSLVRWWDWRNTEHASFDDHSQAYLPHMDKENGRLMSLNLEAVK